MDEFTCTFIAPTISDLFVWLLDMESYPFIQANSICDIGGERFSIGTMQFYKHGDDMACRVVAGRDVADVETAVHNGAVLRLEPSIIDGNSCNVIDVLGGC